MSWTILRNKWSEWSGWALVPVLCLWGCASSAPTPLLSGYSKGDEPICLGVRSEISSFVEKFYATRDLTTEEGKIDYLIERVRSADVVFIRNGEEFKGSHAAEFLRWKLNRLRSRQRLLIETAGDFVSKVAVGSRMSGKPYVVVLSDGSRYSMQQILQNELDQLEQCLRAFAPEPAAVPSPAPVPAEGSEPAEAVSEESPELP